MPHLPETLSAEPHVIWEIPLAQPGLGGIAATQRHLVFGDRDLDDFHDIFRCLDPSSGEILWEVERLAIAALDYGNSPRATPLIHGDRVLLPKCARFVAVYETGHGRCGLGTRSQTTLQTSDRSSVGILRITRYWLTVT